MAAIPRALYAYIEKKLYEQPHRAVCDAAEALIERKEQATGVKSPDVGGGGRSGGVSNRVQDGVMRMIEAERELETATLWASVFTRLDEIFEDRPERDVARMLYREKLPLREIACRRGVDRQTVVRLRDGYVIRAALLAAERGLIRMSEYAEE